MYIHKRIRASAVSVITKYISYTKNAKLHIRKSHGGRKFELFQQRWSCDVAIFVFVFSSFFNMFQTVWQICYTILWPHHRCERYDNREFNLVPYKCHTGQVYWYCSGLSLSVYIRITKRTKNIKNTKKWRTEWFWRVLTQVYVLCGGNTTPLSCHYPVRQLNWIPAMSTTVPDKIITSISDHSDTEKEIG